jgi:glycosyltransferase involved in cell wall biosynthesis
MSFGAVAIIPKQSGVAEVIESALKVDFWDIDRMVSIILDLVQNPSKLAELSAKGMEEVAEVLWEEAARKIINVYSEVTES